MINKDINKIVIVGGGSAGWMSAATFSTFFPEKEIVVIESPDFPRMGVGESTLEQVRYWMYAVGIDIADFMKETDASLKLSIKFTDFYEKGAGSFHYPFGPCCIKNDEYKEVSCRKNYDSYDSNTWLIKKAIYPETPVEDFASTYFPALALIEKNKISYRFENFNLERHSALHFDAVKFANWLRDVHCLPRGVKLISGNVDHILSGDGEIKELLVNGNDEKGIIGIKGDLFVDCTGSKSLLLEGSLNEEFISYNDIIPNNRAWATHIPYVEKEKELKSYTECTAIDNGWVWNIPLWSRVGTGYVYSDKYISKEEALNEFKEYLIEKSDGKIDVEDLEFKDIKMKIGTHKRTWVNNCVAIGISAGFIEPLESNGLLTIHEFLLKLVDTLSRGKINQWDIDAYNSYTFYMFNNFAQFVSLHYKLSVRQDTPYWKDVTTRSIGTKEIVHQTLDRDDFTHLINRKHDLHEYEKNTGITCIANGMNYPVLSYNNLMFNEYYKGDDYLGDIDCLIEFWEKMKKEWSEKAEKEMNLIDFLQKEYYDT